MNKRIDQAYRAMSRLKGEDIATHLAADAEAVARALVVLARASFRDWTRLIHPDVRAAVEAGRKIDAIKIQRQLTDMSLADAKNFVERHFP